ATPQLWRSDGRPEGTLPVKSLPGPGVLALFGAQMAAVGERLFFTGASDALRQLLWTSEGTESTTLVIREFGPQSFVRKLTNVSGKLFLVVGTVDASDEVWCSDGTVAGTQPVFSSGGTENTIDDLTVFKGTLYFTVSDETWHGLGIWKIDGGTGTRV